MSRHINFIAGPSPRLHRKKSKKLTLCYAHPRLETPDDESVVQKARPKPRPSPGDQPAEDGLYVSSTGPLTHNAVKPYQLGHQRAMDTQRLPQIPQKLLEIGIREVTITSAPQSKLLEINSVLVLFQEKVICKIVSPFNRKLYKLLVNNSSDSSNLSLRVQSRDDCCSDLPFPLPTRCVKDKKMEIDFSITDHSGVSHSGTVMYTISLSTQGCPEPLEPPVFACKPTNDPNDPQNCLSLLKARRNIRKKHVGYFTLEDPSLTLQSEEVELLKSKKKEREKLPDLVILEQPVFSFMSLWDISFGNWLQARRPLRPSSGTSGPKFRGGRDEVLTITVLRAVEVPVREESTLVQPIVQIQWGELKQATSASEGAAPVWQQTMHFGIPSRGRDSSIKLSLYDQHPVWGLQWLGEALIPLESPRTYQEVEKWIGLSSLSSPVVRLGYVQASPVRSYTRIYILMRMERHTNGETSEMSSLGNLSRAIQRCLVTPYKISGTESPEDAARLAMLLTPLPSQYGPLTPRQALKLNKIDHYGRAALLATLLRGLGFEGYVLIASSQARNWAAFVVSINEKREYVLWDPENGDQYSFGDSRCSIIKILRIINHQNVWKNLQKTTTLSNIKFNTKIPNDWQACGAASTAVLHEPQLLEIEGAMRDADEDKDAHLEIEAHLKDRLSQWRSGMGLTTVFNRHAMSVLRSFLMKLSSRVDGQLEKKDLRQLYRAYHLHGFVLNLRWSPMDELLELFATTRIQEVTGPVEFALVCHLQRYVGKTSSLWLAVVILRNRD
ncbi:coiled-coil and C2 domain-containing protein 2A-like [Diachasmimorpha longicaudata]|uniref:coiled-coil and C2 domain-containing protein 2A-like n=1 Tax=Diachasmimorpha longicaudata TaxID=58733 RepID=UPI0030B8B590